MGAPVPEGIAWGPRRRRVHRTRRHQLVERDTAIVRWIARHGIVTAELVARRFFCRAQPNTFGRRAAHRRLVALDDLGLIIRSRLFAHGPDLIRVTESGARLANAGVQPAPPPVLAELWHTLTLVWLGESLLAANPGSELITERELRARSHREEASSAPEATGRIPDAVLRIPAGSGTTTIAIELDRVRKDARSMVDIIRGYNHNLDVDGVWWFVAPARVQRVRELVREQRADHRIEVRELPAWPV